jgi:hypothetical protein
MTRLISIMFLVSYISCINLNAQNKEYEICKCDSSSTNIFIYSSREYISNIKNVTQVIKEIESEYFNFKNLDIHFFDDTNNCGYKIDEVILINEDSVEIKTNDVRHHWFATYSKNTGKIRYFKYDNTLRDSIEYLIKK